MPDEKLTVVLLNWARPANVARFAAAYLRMNRVADVIVFDCAGRFNQNDLGDRVVLFKTAYNGDPGLPARFAAAALSRTRDVLLVDDDIDLPEATVDGLHDRFHAVPARPVVGIFGRRPAPDGTYNIGTVHGDVPVVLTRAAVTDRASCARAVDAVHEMAAELGGEPYGNGEDIVLSYAARAATGLSANCAVDLPYRNVGYDDAHAISVRFKGHEAHRTAVVRWCRKRFGG